MSDPVCVQTSDRGKWHMVGEVMRTACGEAVPVGAKNRYLSIVDSRDRCKNAACVTARNIAAGRV